MVYGAQLEFGVDIVTFSFTIDVVLKFWNQDSLACLIGYGCLSNSSFYNYLTLVFTSNFCVRQGCKPLLPSPVLKLEIIRYGSSLNPFEESSKSQKEWFNSNQIVNMNLSTQRPMLIDVQGVQAAEWIVYLIQPFDC